MSRAEEITGYYALARDNRLYVCSKSTDLWKQHMKAWWPLDLHYNDDWLMLVDIVSHGANINDLERKAWMQGFTQERAIEYSVEWGIKLRMFPGPYWTAEMKNDPELRGEGPTHLLALADLWRTRRRIGR